MYDGKNPKDDTDFPAALLNVFTAIEVEFITQANETYYLQSSPDLTNWTTFGDAILGEVEGDGAPILRPRLPGRQPFALQCVGHTAGCGRRAPQSVRQSPDRAYPSTGVSQEQQRLDLS